MKKKILILILGLVLLCQTLVGCSSSQGEGAKTVEIVDHAERAVTVPAPKEIKKVFFTSPIGMIMTYTLAPDKLAGTSMELSPGELEYLQPNMKELPFLGGMQAGAELNRETVINSGHRLFFL